MVSTVGEWGGGLASGLFYFREAGETVIERRLDMLHHAAALREIRD
jgi:hypothetical protein